MQTSSRRISAAFQLGRSTFFGSSLRQTKFGLGPSSSSNMKMATSRTLPSIFGNPIIQRGFGSRAMIPLPRRQSHMTMLRTVQQPFSSCRKCLCEKTTKEVAQTQRPASAEEQIMRVASSEHHQHFSARNATNFDKKLLVYFGKYKSVDEVPSLVSVHLLNSIRNRFRVYVNIFIGFLTMSGCVFMIYRGHTRAGTGETLAHHNMRRHPEHYQKQLKG